MKTDEPLYTLIELTADYVIPGRWTPKPDPAGHYEALERVPPLERARDITLNKGVCLLAVENRDAARTLNLYAVIENVTAGTFSLTGNCWLKCAPTYRVLRPVFAADVVMSPGEAPR